jgi:hypothetical protein
VKSEKKDGGTWDVRYEMWDVKGGIEHRAWGMERVVKKDVRYEIWDVEYCLPLTAYPFS